MKVLEVREDSIDLDLTSVEYDRLVREGHQLLIKELGVDALNILCIEKAVNDALQRHIDRFELEEIKKSFKAAKKRSYVHRGGLTAQMHCSECKRKMTFERDLFDMGSDEYSCRSCGLFRKLPSKD